MIVLIGRLFAMFRLTMLADVEVVDEFDEIDGAYPEDWTDEERHAATHCLVLDEAKVVGRMLQKECPDWAVHGIVYSDWLPFWPFGRRRELWSLGLARRLAVDAHGNIWRGFYYLPLGWTENLPPDSRRIPDYWRRARIEERDVQGLERIVKRLQEFKSLHLYSANN